MAKFCHNCGSQLDDGMLFCGSCGAKQQEAAPQAQPVPQQPVQQVQPQQPVYQQPVYQQPAAPQPPKKKKTGLIVGLSAAIVAVIALVCAGIFWIYPSFFSPEAKYEKYMDQAETALDAEEYDDAIEAYTKAIALKLNKIEPYIGRGDAHFKAENFEDAIDDYESALAINEAEADVYVKIANAYIELDDTDAALEALREGLEITEGDKDIQELIDELDPPLFGGAISDVLPPEINEALSGVGTVIEDSINAIELPDGVNAETVSGIPTAVANTSAAIGNTFAASPYAALTDFIVALVDGQLSASVNMADEEHSLQAQADLCVDLEQLQASLAASMTVDGQSAQADLYIGEDGAAAHSPLVDNNWYGATWATLLDDLENSIFVEQGMIYQEDIDYMREQIDVVMAQLAMLEEAALPVVNDVDLAQYASILLSVSPDIATGTDGGREYMTISVPFETVMYAMSEMFAAMSSDAALAEIYAYISEMEGYDHATAVAEWPEMMGYMAENLNMAASELSGSATVTIYTANGYVDSIVISFDPTVDGETIYFECILNLEYANDMLTDCAVEFYGYDGWDEVFFNIYYQVVSEGALYSDNLYVDYYDGYDEGSMNLTTEWNRETGDVALHMTSDDGYYTDSIELPFKLRSTGSGSELSMDTYEATGVEGTISLSAYPGNPSVTRPNNWIGIEDWDEGLFEKLQNAMMELESMFNGSSTATATPAPSYGTGTALP